MVYYISSGNFAYPKREAMLENRSYRSPTGDLFLWKGGNTMNSIEAKEMLKLLEDIRFLIHSLLEKEEKHFCEICLKI